MVNTDDELANAITEAEAKSPEELTERDKIALMGRPRIGDIHRAQLRVKESKEFKVCYRYYIRLQYNEERRVDLEWIYAFDFRLFVR